MSQTQLKTTGLLVVVASIGVWFSCRLPHFQNIQQPIKDWLQSVMTGLPTVYNMYGIYSYNYIIYVLIITKVEQAMKGKNHLVDVYIPHGNAQTMFVLKWHDPTSTMPTTTMPTTTTTTTTNLW